MNIQKFDLNTLCTVYGAELSKDFHAQEIKPLEMVKKSYEQGLYFGYGLYNEKDLVGYAFFCVSPDHRTLLLDYYAICAPYRNKGYGGVFLQELKKTLQDHKMLIIEVENPAYAVDDADKHMRLRRISFYENNGCVLTGICSSLFNCDYSIMKLDLSSSPDDDGVRAGLTDVYLGILGTERFKKHVRLFRNKKEL